MGQQHYSPGQSEATERREVPPWVTAEGALQNICITDGWFVSPFQGIWRRVFVIPRASLRSALDYDVKARWAKIARVAPKKPLFQNSLSTLRA